MRVTVVNLSLYTYCIYFMQVQILKNKLFVAYIDLCFHFGSQGFAES